MAIPLQPLNVQLQACAHSASRSQAGIATPQCRGSESANTSGLPLVLSSQRVAITDGRPCIERELRGPGRRSVRHRLKVVLGLWVAFLLFLRCVCRKKLLPLVFFFFFCFAPVHTHTLSNPRNRARSNKGRGRQTVPRTMREDGCPRYANTAKQDLFMLFSFAVSFR